MSTLHIDAAYDNWTLFVEALDQVDPFTGDRYDVCPAVCAYYQEVNDDSELPPYDAPALRCTALDKLF